MTTTWGGCRPTTNLARILCGLAFILMGSTIMWCMWHSPLPKPFTGDGFMTASYLKATVWILAGAYIPASDLSMKRALVGAYIVIALTILLLYVHAQLTF